MASIRRKAISLTIYMGDDQIDMDAPTMWEICPACDGDGETSYPDHYSDDENDYIIDHCECCAGKGKRLVIDHDRFKAADPLEYAAWVKQVEDDEHMDAMIASERRYGA